MSKEFSTPEDITQTVIDEEAFSGYAVETLITPELFYTEDMVKAEYNKMSSAEKIEFQEGVKASEAYQKAYGHCAPWRTYSQEIQAHSPRVGKTNCGKWLWNSDGKRHRRHTMC